MKKQIKYLTWGLANSYDNYIELNKNLKVKKYKTLRNYIIQHEQGHDMNRFDLFYEFNINIRILPVLLWFVLIHPSTWIDFLPIQYKEKQLIYDVNLLMLYSIIFLLILIFSYVF